jgi:hypothetical protein
VEIILPKYDCMDDNQIHDLKVHVMILIHTDTFMLDQDLTNKDAHISYTGIR